MFELHVSCFILSADEGQNSAEVSCEDCVTLMSSVGVLRNHARHCTAVSCEDCRTLMSSVEVVRSHIRHCKSHQGEFYSELLPECMNCDGSCGFCC